MRRLLRRLCRRRLVLRRLRVRRHPRRIARETGVGFRRRNPSSVAFLKRNVARRRRRRRKNPSSGSIPPRRDPRRLGNRLDRRVERNPRRPSPRRLLCRTTARVESFRRTHRVCSRNRPTRRSDHQTHRRRRRRQRRRGRSHSQPSIESRRARASECFDAASRAYSRAFGNSPRFFRNTPERSTNAVVVGSTTSPTPGSSVDCANASRRRRDSDWNTTRCWRECRFQFHRPNTSSAPLIRLC